MKGRYIPTRKQSRMSIFAIALVPEGNVLRQVRRIASFSIRPGGRAAARALPEGIYLGFYGERVPRDEGFVRSFNRGARTLFAGLPPLLVFTTAKRSEEKWYLVPDSAISPNLPAAADAIALEAGCLPLESPPLTPGEGFFAGNDVTLPHSAHFHFDISTRCSIVWRAMTRPSPPCAGRCFRGSRDAPDPERPGRNESVQVCPVVKSAFTVV